nr:uncharacterized protein LOC104108815 [Nicotiana tomentosiformis]
MKQYIIFPNLGTPSSPSELRNRTLSFFMTQKLFCMVMRINIDCKGCYMKVSRALLTIPELETRFIEKNHSRVIVCGNFVPQDVAIKIRKKTNRRVEILEIQDLSGSDEKQEEQMPLVSSC